MTLIARFVYVCCTIVVCVCVCVCTICAWCVYDCVLFFLYELLRVCMICLCNRLNNMQNKKPNHMHNIKHYSTHSNKHTMLSTIIMTCIMITITQCVIGSLILHNTIIIISIISKNKHTNNDKPTCNMYYAHFLLAFGMCFLNLFARFVYVGLYDLCMIWLSCLYDVCMMCVWSCMVCVSFVHGVVCVCILCVWFCTILIVIICITICVIISTTVGVLCVIWS